MTLAKLGGRKLIGATLILSIAILMVYLKGDVPERFQTLLEVVYGSFVAGNSFSKLMAPKAAPPVTPSVTPAVVAPSIDTDEMNKTLTLISQGIVTTQDLLTAIIRRTGIDKMPEPK